MNTVLDSRLASNKILSSQCDHSPHDQIKQRSETAFYSNPAAFPETGVLSLLL